MEGFAPPDFNAPLDVETLVAGTPADGTTKGMYLASLLQEVKKAGKQLEGPTGYVAFKDYPLRQYMLLAVDVAGVLFPDVPVREGLRRLGWLSYPTFVTSLIGRVVMGVLGRDIVNVTKATGKAYRLSGTPGDAEIIEVDETHSLLRLTEVYSFIDCLQVGVFEGAFRHLGYEYTVEVKLESPSSGILRSTYTRRD